MMEFMRDAFADMPGMSGSMRSYFEQIDKLEGFPIATRDLEDGRVVSESQVKAMRAEAIAASQFAPPAGYREEKLISAPGQ
jgi:hypothetical protein